MNEKFVTFAERQRQRLGELRADTPDIAELVADDVWSCFDKELNEHAEGGVLLEYTDVIGVSLLAELSNAFDEAVEVHIHARCQKLYTDMMQAAGEASEAVAVFELDRLIKVSLLKRDAQPLIEQAMKGVSPGLAHLLVSVAADLARDPIQLMEDVDDEMALNARNFRRSMRALRPAICRLVVDDSRALLQAARLDLAQRLDALCEQAAQPA